MNQNISFLSAFLDEFASLIKIRRQVKTLMILYRNIFVVLNDVIRMVKSNIFSSSKNWYNFKTRKCRRILCSLYITYIYSSLRPLFIYNYLYILRILLLVCKFVHNKFICYWLLFINKHIILKLSAMAI